MEEHCQVACMRVSISHFVSFLFIKDIFCNYLCQSPKSFKAIKAFMYVVSIFLNKAKAMTTKAGDNLI